MRRSPWFARRLGRRLPIETRTLAKRLTTVGTLCCVVILQAQGRPTPRSFSHFGRAQGADARLTTPSCELTAITDWVCDLTGQSFVILVGGRLEAPIECGAGLRKVQSKRKIPHPLFAFFQLAVHTARPNSLALFRFGVGRSSAWPVKRDIKVEPHADPQQNGKNPCVHLRKSGLAATERTGISAPADRLV